MYLVEQRALLRWPLSWRLRYQRWLDRRIPAQTSVTLNQRNLFIFLSRSGGYFLVLVALIWVGATNYQNNLAYALCFFLLALLFAAILYSFANLSGLSLRFIDAPPIFAGEVARCRFELVSPTAHHQLLLHWPGQAESCVSVDAGEAGSVWLTHGGLRRGLQRLGRMHLCSVFPVGLLRCWTWLDLSVMVLVYPAPVEADYRHCCTGSVEDESELRAAAGDEYFSLKPYVAGEPVSRIAWRQFAAGRGLFVRENLQWQGGSIMLDLAALTDADLELRLSKLCYCALQLQARGVEYGLQLGQQRIEPASGDAHLQRVLTALALW